MNSLDISTHCSDANKGIHPEQAKNLALAARASADVRAPEIQTEPCGNTSAGAVMSATYLILERFQREVYVREIPLGFSRESAITFIVTCQTDNTVAVLRGAVGEPLLDVSSEIARAALDRLKETNPCRFDLADEIRRGYYPLIEAHIPDAEEEVRGGPRPLTDGDWADWLYERDR